MTTLAERRHMNAVAGLGCILCRRLGYNDTPAAARADLDNAILCFRAMAAELENGKA